VVVVDVDAVVADVVVVLFLVREVEVDGEEGEAIGRGRRGERRGREGRGRYLLVTVLRIEVSDDGV
jgi:hypothetical protein